MKVETRTDAVRELARRARALAIGRTIGEAVPETLEALAAERDAAHARAERLEGLLRSWASVSKSLGLNVRNANIADYDDEIASLLAEVAAKTLQWREEAALATQEGRDGE